MADPLLNPAEEAAEKAWATLQSHLVERRSFVFEAGAGAGKTHSLIEALKFIIERDGQRLVRNQQRIACITFTNVARDTIIARTDGHPAIFCETTHAFAWLLISSFQPQLREAVKKMAAWAERIREVEEIDKLHVGYALGRRGIEDGKLLLHHDDIFPITIELLKSTKFRSVVTSLFPVILIDEYQDTNAALITAISKHFLGQPKSPQLGFFGDHWQKIYGDGCGTIQHASLKRVEKGANFRSVKVIVDCLNRLRPDLIQHAKDPNAPGMVRVFHTNGWQGQRQTRNHWQGDLPAEAARKAFSYVRSSLINQDEWDLSSDVTKILMLTHRALATELGYASLPGIFRFNDSFSRKANSHIAYFADRLEPAVLAFIEKRYGAMFEAFGHKAPGIMKPGDKATWSAVMNQLCELRQSGTVGQVIDHLLISGRIFLPDEIVRIESELKDFNGPSSEMSRQLAELQKFRIVPYAEVSELVRYLHGHSPFETKHGVKGAQFENVLGVFGRGWNDYDFNEFLEMIDNPVQISNRSEEYERYRNLFYVVCSRPKKRLTLLFTQKLSHNALRALNGLFGPNTVYDIGSLI